MVIATTAAGCQEVEWEDIFQLGTGRPSSTNLSMMNGINNLSCNPSYGSVMADQIHPTLNLGPKFRILSRTW